MGPAADDDTLFHDPVATRYLTISAWISFMWCHESLTLEQVEIIQWALDRQGVLDIQDFIAWKVAHDGAVYGAH